MIVLWGFESANRSTQAETFHCTPWFKSKSDGTAHGSDGPLHTAPHEPYGISNLVLEAFQEKGFPLIHDVFSTGESPHACGHALRSIYKGIRSTSADYITNSKSEGQLHIANHTYVDKVILEDAKGSRRVSAVQLRGIDGKLTVAKVLQEAILCGGAYGSPAILLRSGIGPSAELEGLGIACQIERSGVGGNLMDHPVSSNLFQKP